MQYIIVLKMDVVYRTIKYRRWYLLLEYKYPTLSTNIFCSCFKNNIIAVWQVTIADAAFDYLKFQKCVKNGTHLVGIQHERSQCMLLWVNRTAQW